MYQVSATMVNQNNVSHARIQNVLSKLVQVSSDNCLLVFLVDEGREKIGQSSPHVNGV